MHVVHNDGSEAEVSAGEAYEIQPGHDAWVVGDEPVVAFEFDASAVATFRQGVGLWARRHFVLGHRRRVGRAPRRPPLF